MSLYIVLKCNTTKARGTFGRKKMMFNIFIRTQSFKEDPFAELDHTVFQSQQLSRIKPKIFIYTFLLIGNSNCA